MATLYFSVRVPESTYNILTLNDVDLEKSVCFVMETVAKKISYPKDEIEFIYCGYVMDESKKMKKLNVKPFTLIHVFKKVAQPSEYRSTNTYSEEDCQRIADLFGTVTGTQVHVRTRIQILQKILTEFPEFRKNLGAQALIRDSILFHTLSKVEVIKKVAENYPVVCDAAEFIVKTTKKEIAKNERISFGEETFSDQTSSSEEENSSGPSRSEMARIRRISRDQLAVALMLAGTASLNSLSNIAQRNTGLPDDLQPEAEPQQEQTQSSSSAEPASTSSTRISSSIFSSALNRALLSSTSNPRGGQGDQVQSMDTSETQSQPQPLQAQPQQQPEQGSGDNNQSLIDILNVDQSSERYANELQVMKEMGLTNAGLNLQALIFSNGDIHAAVNLVLGGIHDLFN